MRKKIPIITFWLIVAGCIVYYSINIFDLFSKSYYFDESQLYKIDTFHLSGRAHKDDDKTGSRGPYQPKLVFKSTNGYSFSIDKNIYKAIVNREKLEDTLLYHDLKFSIYSSREYFNKYHKTDKPIYIRVYQIQVGDTKYIDIARFNEIRKSGTLLGVFAPPLIILFIGFLIHKEMHRPGWCTTLRLIIWFFAFLFATMLLFILIF